VPQSTAARPAFAPTPENERPLNLYGFSKLAFDNHVRSVVARSEAVLRYGPVEEVSLHEIPIDERAPILKAYLARAPSARPHFEIDHHFREGPPRVEFGRKVFYRPESVSAWIASCDRPEPRAGRARWARLRAVDPSRVPISMQRNNVGPLAEQGGSHN
jgi:hypothetical protein